QLVDTGMSTATGGRSKRLRGYVGNETFMLTWGDGVSNVDIRKLLEFHRSHGKLATLTAVHPVARFGHLELDGDVVSEFSEKPRTKQGWINGAFFVLEPQVFDYIEGDETQWDYEPMMNLARDGQLMAYKHTDFWLCMDTLRERKLLEELWSSGKAPWRIWDAEQRRTPERAPHPRGASLTYVRVRSTPTRRGREPPTRRLTYHTTHTQRLTTVRRPR